ncbi:hypothetical protein [Oscillibacter sp.]|uniref:hypothetical protein n=1 Tax=Oscillibacter sp. TaxID=1945593 RepID=UPI003398133F
MKAEQTGRYVASGLPIRRLDEKIFVPCNYDHTDNMLTKKAQTVTKVLKNHRARIKYKTAVYRVAKLPVYRII